MSSYTVPLTMIQYTAWLASYNAGDFPGKRLGEAFQDDVLRNSAIVDIRLYYQASPTRAKEMILSTYVTP